LLGRIIVSLRGANLVAEVMLRLQSIINIPTFVYPTVHFVSIGYFGIDLGFFSRGVG
jgi:hypothetical protein